MTDQQDEAPTGSRPKRKRRGSTGQAIGGAIVGFDYQVFRATKPPAELVEAAAPVRGVSGEDGSLLTVGFPDDEPAAPVPDPIRYPSLAPGEGLE